MQVINGTPGSHNSTWGDLKVVTVEGYVLLAVIGKDGGTETVISVPIAEARAVADAIVGEARAAAERKLGEAQQLLAAIDGPA